jgi:hypothetical protein
LVFTTRYLDLFITSPFGEFKYFYLFAVKIFYIATSIYIVFLMTFAYARTREREMAWKLGTYCLMGALVLAAPLCKIFEKGPVIGTLPHTDIDYTLYSHPFKFGEVCSTSACHTVTPKIQSN